MILVVISLHQDRKNYCVARVEGKKHKGYICNMFDCCGEHLNHVCNTDQVTKMWNAVCDMFQWKLLLNQIKAWQAFYSVKVCEGEEWFNLLVVYVIGFLP